MIYIFFIFLFNTIIKENLSPPVQQQPIQQQPVQQQQQIQQPIQQAAPAPVDTNANIQIQLLSSQVNVLSEKVKQLSNDVDPIKQKIQEFQDVLNKKD